MSIWESNRPGRMSALCVYVCVCVCECIHHVCQRLYMHEGIIVRVLSGSSNLRLIKNKERAVGVRF